MREPADVLARARVIHLVSSLADGGDLDALAQDVDRFALRPHLGVDEGAWLRGETTPDASVAWQIEAMLALAWSLGLASELGARDPLAYGPVQEQLADDVVVLAPREPEEIHGKLAELDQIARDGELPPPNERYGAPCVRWRRAALHWVMDPSRRW